MVKGPDSQKEDLLFPQRQGDMGVLGIKGQDKEEEEEEKEKGREYTKQEEGKAKEEKEKEEEEEEWKKQVEWRGAHSTPVNRSCSSGAQS